MKGMRRCVICKDNKKLTEFNKNRSRKDGLQLHCKECSKAKSKAYYKLNKEKYFVKASERKKLLAHYVMGKLKSGCVDCGETDIIVLDFDHVQGNKVRAVSELVKRGVCTANIDAEIAKCVIRCSNCHRKKTAKENNWLRYLTSET